MAARDKRLTDWFGGATPHCCASRFLSLPVTPGNRRAKPSGEPACQSYAPRTSRTPEEKLDDNLEFARLTSR